MPATIAIGHSQIADPQEAAYQAAMMAKQQLKSAPVDMVFLFSSVHYAYKEVLEAVHTVLKPSRLVGASSAGIILSDSLFRRGIVIVAIHSSTLTFGSGFTLYNPNQELRSFGFELNRKFSLDYKSNIVRQASVVFCDGLLPYSDDFVLGAQEILGNTCPMVGAFSCDDFKFKKSYQYCQKQVLSRAATGFLIGSSDSTIAFSNKHGFMPLGKPRTITLAEGNYIRTIDHKPASHLYEEFLQSDIITLRKGILGSAAMLYPLGIYLEKQRQYLVRYPVDILDDGSIVCQADVPTGTEVHLMINNKDSCRAAAAKAATEIKDALEGRQPQLVLVFENLLRHKILGRNLLLEIKSIKEILGLNTPLVGMYSFGELCRMGSENTPATFLQNGNLLLVAIG